MWKRRLGLGVILMLKMYQNRVYPFRLSRISRIFSQSLMLSSFSCSCSVLCFLSIIKFRLKLWTSCFCSFAFVLFILPLSFALAKTGRAYWKSRIGNSWNFLCVHDNQHTKHTVAVAPHDRQEKLIFLVFFLFHFQLKQHRTVLYVDSRIGDEANEIFYGTTWWWHYWLTKIFSHCFSAPFSHFRDATEYSENHWKILSEKLSFVFANCELLNVADMACEYIFIFPSSCTPNISSRQHSQLIEFSVFLFFLLFFLIFHQMWTWRCWVCQCWCLHFAHFYFSFFSYSPNRKIILYTLYCVVLEHDSTTYHGFSIESHFHLPFFSLTSGNWYRRMAMTMIKWEKIYFPKDFPPARVSCVAKWKCRQNFPFLDDLFLSMPSTKHTINMSKNLFLTLTESKKIHRHRNRISHASAETLVRYFREEKHLWIKFFSMKNIYINVDCVYNRRRSERELYSDEWSEWERLKQVESRGSCEEVEHVISFMSSSVCYFLFRSKFIWKWKTATITERS